MSKHAHSQLQDKGPYRRLFAIAVLSIGFVSIAPLLLAAWMNFHQYQKAYREAFEGRISERTATTGRSLEFFLSERISALSLAVRTQSLDELGYSAGLGRLLQNMQTTFGGVTDLGFIEMSGRQAAYAGPFQLKGKDYSTHEWFREVTKRGVYVSDVFLGYRKFPHFVIAVRDDVKDGQSFVLRATVDTESVRRILGADDPSFCDVFLINRDGVVQTPSRRFGGVLSGRLPLPPKFSKEIEIREVSSKTGPLLLSTVAVEHSPFVLAVASKPSSLQEHSLSLFKNLILFLVTSILLISAAVVFGSLYMVRRLMETERKRELALRQAEHADKMAAIGRLASGVAHEINNPLAVIYEKAGLLSDLLSDRAPSAEIDRYQKLVDSVSASVERCSVITRRLLGFAKQVKVMTQSIRLGNLLTEVREFLEKEAHLRRVAVRIDIPDDLPSVESDRGQLQQVFLNILQNAFAAVKDGGHITIEADAISDREIIVRIRDDGAGIPKEHLPHIFEPFFSTKEGAGTGLGLSITFGIVERLGGRIAVESEVGEGTTFTVTLPIVKVE